MTLYTPIRVARAKYIAANYEPRLYTKEDHCCIMLHFPTKFLHAIHTESLDDLLADSEFDSVLRASMVRSAPG